MCAMAAPTDQDDFEVMKNSYRSSTSNLALSEALQQLEESRAAPRSPRSPQAFHLSRRGRTVDRSPSPRTPRSPRSPHSPRSPSVSRSPSPHPSSPFRGGNLAYLASRRSSRDSERGEPTPLDCTRFRHRRTSNFLELPVPNHQRPRVCSLPDKPYNPRDRGDIYRLRTFSITSKGVVNRGDSLISRSNTSVCSTATHSRSPSGTRTPYEGSPRTSRPSSRSGERSGNKSPFEGSCCGSSYNSSEQEKEDKAIYRVMMLGEAGVGKSSLINQFMSSEYMNTYDASLGKCDDEFGEKSVSVLLDGEESEIIFIDHPAHEMSAENALTTYAPHACVVVYSITDQASLKSAEDTLSFLWREGFIRDNSVILVGNKSDMVRARVVTIEEGKSMAQHHDTKFIETSSGVQHNVDELLVGILKQIRLRVSRQRKKEVADERKKRMPSSRTSVTLNTAKEMLGKLCIMDSKSKSCENLLVL
ncbi:uncharacterized protein LOC119098256 [Pollicipes pollicipes]|uniref:uncharacterized protein LOC119098256 n=1 Tax=Pollicipes pollicipes TaxID=41117 RepID=UPI0018856A07|nr:uncharacterized protein LOC119098256 [Pollicipes pollicipes]